LPSYSWRPEKVKMMDIDIIHDVRADILPFGCSNHVSTGKTKESQLYAKSLIFCVGRTGIPQAGRQVNQ